MATPLLPAGCNPNRFSMLEIVQAAHLTTILFLLIGFAVGLATNHTYLRLIHAGLLAGITVLMIFGVPCPLTLVEESLTGTSYEGSFLAVWLNRIIYLTWFDPESVFMMDMAFAVLVFSSFYWRPLNRGKKNSAAPNRRET